MSYLPSFMQSYRKPQENDTESTISRPFLRYICIFNPNLVDANSESNEDLQKQIVCFESAQGNHMDLSAQLNVIGLCQGVTSLSNEFSQSDKIDQIIEMDNYMIIMSEVEPQFFMISAIDVMTIDAKTVSKQLCICLKSIHKHFTLLNQSMTTQMNDMGKDILSRSVSKYWGLFISCWNNNTNLNKFFPWANSLNYRGFLGTFPGYTKNSSIHLCHTCQNEIDILLKEESPPVGVLIANFENTPMKNYGLVYQAGSVKMNQVYNYLEWYEWSGRLNKEGINKEIFEFERDQYTEGTINGQQDIGSIVNGNTQQNEDVQSILSFKNVTNSTLETLNPVNLTNNLVIQPLNYTVNEVKRIGESTQTWILNPFGSTESTSNQNESLEEEPAIEPNAEFLIGLIDIEALDNCISKRLIYIDDKEYSLVIFKKGTFVIALAYDSALEQLDDPEFYLDLERNYLTPVIEEISHSELGDTAGGVSTSVQSLKSLNGILTETQDFFFIIIDPEENSIKTSLPYLPNLEKTIHRNAIFYLHDLLLDLFVIQNQEEFFKENVAINEFFHKFNGVKNSDWMFYYFRYKGKFISVIKNHRNTKKRINSTTKITPTPGTSTSTGFFNNLTNGITDYTSLGFLENLGDDVKAWLESFSASGET